MPQDNNHEISPGTFFCVMLAPLISCVLIALSPNFSWISLQMLTACFAFGYVCYLLLMIRDFRTVKKGYAWAAGMLAESLVALFYQATEGEPFSPANTLLEFLNGNLILCLWLLALAISTFYTLTLGFRAMRWTQTTWDELQKLKREHKIEAQKRSAEDKATLQSLKREHKIDAQKQRTQAKKERLERKYEHQNKTHEQKLDNDKKIRDIHWKNSQNEAKESGDVGGLNGILRTFGPHLLGAVMVIGALLLFIHMPFFAGRIANWVEVVNQFNKPLQDNAGNPIDAIDVILKQALILIACFTVVIGAGIFLALAIQSLGSLLGAIFSRNKTKVRNVQKRQLFMDQYTMPLTIFILALAFLRTLSKDGNDLSLDSLLPFFTRMVVVVLHLFLALVAVDALRLGLDQCIQKGALFRTAMHLSFALIIERMMGIVLGVLVAADSFGLISSVTEAVKGMLSSMFSSVTKKKPSSEKSVSKKVSATMKNALNREIDIINESSRGYHGNQSESVPFSNFEKFHRKGWSKENMP